MIQGKGLSIPPVFVPAGEDPYDMFEWETRDSRITKMDGTVVFEMTGVEVPAHWSQTATDVVVSKYFRKAGVRQADGESYGPERSARQVVGRLAATWRWWGEEYGYFATPEDAHQFENEIAYMLLAQIAAPNSPQWFNTGLHLYGIEGPAQGHYYVDPSTATLTRSSDAYSHPQTSACFIQPIDDNLVNEGGIMDLWTRESRIFKYGSGTGTNFSTLRGKGEPLSGGGSSSGLISFLRVGDRAAGAIKSGGTTRRAAKMCILDIDHPDIEEFVTWKWDEEKKAHALIAAGYAPDFNGPAYDTISGQNANNSVRVTDAFMSVVENDGRWPLIRRTDGEVDRYVLARDLWGKIADAAWNCADPGVQYHDTINEWHTCANTEPIRASNPCSEFMFLDNTSCNLASLNLHKFVDFKNEFDFRGFEHAVRLWTIVLEISVLMSQYPSAPIAQRSYEFRPLGLGYANLGTMLMRMGHPYDSEIGRSLAATITSLMSAVSYRTSAEMASFLGPFPRYEENKTSMLRVIRNHALAACGRVLDDPTRPGTTDGRAFEGVSHVWLFDNELVPEDLWAASMDAWDQAITLGERYGYRNSQVTLLAPTGTIGMAMDCDTTGIEPAYSLVAYKNLAGGGTMVLTNQTVPLALQTLGYNTGFSKDINPILDYVKEKGTIRGAPRVQPEHYPVFDCANDISPEGHLLMMAAVQPFLSGAISKTINLAQNTTVAQVAETYYNGWKYGLKAVALYRDGSKVSAPLLTKAGFDREAGADGKMYTEADLVAAVAEAKNEVRQELLAQTPGLQRQERKKLPAKRTGTTHELVIAGQKMYLRTGEYEDGSLGEIFIDMHKEGAAFRSMMNCFAIAISKGLQYGVPLEEFIETFAHTRFEPAGPVQGHPNLKMAGSVVDAVFRILGHDYLGISELVQNPDQTRDDAGATLPLTLSQNGHTPMSGHHPWKELRDKVLADPERAANVERIGAEMDKELVAVATKPRVALSQDAPMCHECGHLTTRNGTCFKCNNCGATTGCS